MMKIRLFIWFFIHCWLIKHQKICSLLSSHLQVLIVFKHLLSPILWDIKHIDSLSAINLLLITSCRCFLLRWSRNTKMMAKRITIDPLTLAAIMITFVVFLLVEDTAMSRLISIQHDRVKVKWNMLASCW